MGSMKGGKMNVPKMKVNQYRRLGMCKGVMRIRPVERGGC